VPDISYTPSQIFSLSRFKCRAIDVIPHRIHSGHSLSYIAASFDTFAAFIAQLQVELHGITSATAISTQGIYTAATFTLAANSITLVLDD